MGIVKRIMSVILAATLAASVFAGWKPVTVMAGGGTENKAEMPASYTIELSDTLSRALEEADVVRAALTADVKAVKKTEESIAEAAEKEEAEEKTAEEKTAEKEAAEKKTAEEKTAKKEAAEKKETEEKTAKKEEAEKKTAENNSEKSSEKAAEALEKAKSYSIPLGSVKKHRDAEDAVDAFLGAMQKFDRKKIQAYYKAEGIEETDAGNVDALFGKLDELLETEDIPKESEKAVMKIAATVLDYDYEIIGSKKNKDVTDVEIRFKTYDFVSIAENMKGRLLAGVAIIYLTNPGISDKDLILKVLPIIEKSLQNPGKKTAASTVTIQCREEDGVWITEDSEEIVKAATGDLNLLIKELQQLKQ